MAFVYRNPKPSDLFSERKNSELLMNDSSTKIINSSIQQSKSSTQIVKGLPCLNQIHQKSLSKVNYKQNLIAQITERPIHKGGGTLFRQGIPNIYQNDSMNQHTSKDHKEGIQQLMQIKQVKTNTIPSSLLQNYSSKQLSKPTQFNWERLQIKTQQLSRTPTILNANLLKTMQSILQDHPKPNPFQILQINYKEQQNNKKLLPHYRIMPQKRKQKLNPSGFSANLLNSNTFPQSIITSLSIIGKEKSKQQGSLKLNQKQNAQKDTFAKDALLEQDHSSSQDEYDPQSTPGPGSYNIQTSPKPQFRSKKEKIQQIFYSNLQRFVSPSQKFQDISYVNQQQINFIPSRHEAASGFFLSKLPKFYEVPNEVTPPPGYYNTRQTLEHKLIRNLLHSSNTTIFINSSPRIPIKANIQGQPGPGSYTLDSKYQKLLQDQNQNSYTFKSSVLRKLSPQNSKQSKLSQDNFNDQLNKAKNVHLIHVKQDYILEQQYQFENPPFLSNSQRFPPSKISNQHYIPPKLSKNEVTQQPSNAPFNSSSPRQMSIEVGSGAGVGIYNILSNQGLNKKSFNALFT